MLLVQAYTVELEAELNHLKEENERLRAEEVLGTETFFFGGNGTETFVHHLLFLPCTMHLS